MIRKAHIYHKQKREAFFFAFLFIYFLKSMNCVSQPPTSNQDSLIVVAHVENVFTHAPIVGAKVEIMTEDSTVIHTTTSSSIKLNYRQGGFEFTVTEPGRYIIHCSHPEYEESYTDVDLTRFYKHETYRLGIKCMMQHVQPKPPTEENDPFELGEVVVKATKVKFYMDKDTLVYNADAFNLTEGSMLDVLIRQLPGVELKSDGQIFVNGKVVDELLLNGKDFIDRDRKLILDNLPSFMVKNVKVYDKESNMKQKAIGEDTGRKQVMDIGLKREYSIDWFASAEAGGGTDNRFLSRLFAMRFTPNSSVTVFANANNLNDNRTPGQNDEWTPETQASGIATTRMAGLNYNVEDSRVRYMINGGLSVHHNDNDLKTKTSSASFLEGGDTYGLGKSSAYTHDTKVSTSHQFHILPFTSYEFYLMPSFSYHTYRKRSEILSSTFSEDMSTIWGKNWLDSLSYSSSAGIYQQQMLNQLKNNTIAKGHDIDFKLLFYKVFRIPHNDLHMLGLRAYYNYDGNKNKTYDHYNLEYQKQSIKDNRNRYNNNSDRHHELYVGIEDYIKLRKKDRIIPSYSFIRSHRDTKNSFYLLHLIDGWKSGDNHILGELPSVMALQEAMDTQNSSHSITTDYTHKLQLRYEWESWGNNNENQTKIIAVLPLEIQRNNMRYLRSSIDTLMHRNLTHLSPWLSIQRYLGKRNLLEMNYNYRIEAPSMTYLVAYHDDCDPLNILQVRGNKLSSRHTHHADLNWQRTLSGQRMLNINGVFNHHRNSLALGYVYDRSTGVRTITPTTVNGNWDIKLSGGYSAPLDSARRFRLETNTSISYVNSADMIDLHRSVVKSFYADEMLKLEYRPSSDLSIGFKGDLHYQHSRSRREDFSTINVIDFDYALTTQIVLPWNMQLSTDLTMYSRRGYSDKSMNTNELVWNARLSKRLLKDRLTLMVDGFDILGNLSNVRRTINAQGRTETWSNVIPRYVLFHVSYRFNKQPKKH